MLTVLRNPKLIWMLVRILIMTQIAGLILGNLVYKQSSLPRKIVYDEVTINRTINYIFGDEKPEMEPIHLMSDSGYNMVGTYFPNPVKTQNTMIVVHGIGDVRWGMLRVTKWFLDLGFNVVIYDSRASGETGGKDITLGYYEKDDLQKWVDLMSSKRPDGVLGVFGNSMGGSIAILQAEENEIHRKVDFYVVDSPYSNLKDEIHFQVSYSYSVLTNVMVFYSNIINKIRSGFYYEEVNPLESIKSVSVPILFFHGDSDGTIPVYMTNDLYDAKDDGDKSILIVKGADHLESYFTEPDIYMKKLRSFVLNQLP